jgi:hypothetical protein
VIQPQLTQIVLSEPLGLDLYIKAQELASHPALKPKERAHLQSLLALVKADIENSDDEGEDESRDQSDLHPFSDGVANQSGDCATGTPAPHDSPQKYKSRDQSNLCPFPDSAANQSRDCTTGTPAAHDTPTSQTPLDLSLPPRPIFECPSPTRELRKEGNFFALPHPIGPPRTACPSFGDFSRVDTPSVVDNGFPNVLNPAYAHIPDDSPGRKNEKGETSFMTAKGDQLYDSIMASVNQNLPPAQTKPVEPMPTPQPNEPRTTVPPTNKNKRPEVIREREERRPNYRFPNVRLEGMDDNNGRSKRPRVEDSDNETDAEGSTDEEYVQKERSRQVAVILDHGMGHPAPFRRGPPNEPTTRYHPLVDDFLSLELMNGMKIPRNPTQGSSNQLPGTSSRRGARGERPGGNQSSRAPCKCFLSDYPAACFQ